MIFVDTDHVCELILDLPLEAGAVLQLLFDLFLWCFSHDFFFCPLSSCLSVVVSFFTSGKSAKSYTHSTTN